MATISEYPLLTHFGMWSIDPAWHLDKDDEVRPSGEFESFPMYFLDVRSRPTSQELKVLGGYRPAGTRFDILVDTFNEMFPALQLENGEELRQELLSEIDLYERTYRI